jgi:hypothetical protein
MVGSSCHHDGVAPFGDRRINACSRLPHAYRSYATSFIGTQRRGIHPLLILSSQQEDLVWTILDRLFHAVDSVDDASVAQPSLTVAQFRMISIADHAPSNTLCTW